MSCSLAGVKVCCEDGQCGCEPLSFLTQKKLTSKQARLQELLAEFDFVLEYRAGRTNQVAKSYSLANNVRGIQYYLYFNHIRKSFFFFMSGA
jgi:hypothetical protein